MFHVVGGFELNGSRSFVLKFTSAGHLSGLGNCFSENWLFAAWRMNIERSRRSLREGSIRSFVFRADLFFFVWLQFCQGAVAPTVPP
ncbi:MAG: hypothetical protein WAM53_01315, partial [Terrimicrobiaceae bacterium]